MGAFSDENKIVFINLVSTPEQINRSFPEFDGDVSRIASIKYPVDINKVQSKLGQFLATHISTTRFDDDAHRVLLITNRTEWDLYMLELAKHIEMMRGIQPYECISRIEGEIASLRSMLKMYDEEQFTTLRSYYYQWPVYGSANAGDAVTPEQYFDHCANQIRRADAVVAWAGLGQTPIPESIARTMAGNHGLELLTKWRNGGSHA